jgi:Uma2 family endonuclease
LQVQASWQKITARSLLAWSDPMKPRANDTHHYTYADYLTWPEGPSDELIDGTLYVREPTAPTLTHQGIVGELYGQAYMALREKPCKVYVAPVDVRLPKSTEPDLEIDTIVQPDILIVCDEQKLDARGVRGAPDWIAEVLSPSTASYDRNIKVPVYERAGVRELWLVDPIDRSVAIYRLKAGQYGRPSVLELKGEMQIAAVPDVTIDWDRVIARLS